MRAKVAERGQITIPQKFRKQLGIRSGTVLNFEVRGHSLIAMKVDHDDPIKKVYGCLGKVLHTDKIISKLRGDHDNDGG